MDSFIIGFHKNNRDNLTELSSSFSLIGERRVLELHDVASEISLAICDQLASGLTLAEALALVGQSPLVLDYQLHEDHLLDNRDRLRLLLTRISDVDRVVFTSLLKDALERNNITITEGDFWPEEDVDELITYVKNPLSDEAFDVFSQDMTYPRLSYRHSFRECASSINRGDCGYALFPLEERGGVRLPTVTELLRKNDFKINAITPVFGPRGDSELKYALVSRFFLIPVINEDDDLYLEVRIDSSSSSLSSLLCAAELFGHSVFRINTVTSEEDGETSSSLNLVFKDEGRRGFGSLLLYLALFSEDHVTEGIYKNLE